MGQRLQGKNTRVLFGIMSAELLKSNSASGLLLPPSNVQVSLTAAVPWATAADIDAGTQTIAVAALPGPIARGCVLALKTGTVVRRVTLAKHAKTGDQSLVILPVILPEGTLPARAALPAIAATAATLHKGLIQLRGGKKADIDIKAEDEEVMTFTDLELGEPDLGFSGFKTGAIKSKAASFPYEALVDPDDIGYSMAANAGASGSQTLVYARLILPNGEGYSRGEVYQGEAELVGWKVTLTPESFAMCSTEIKFRGKVERFDALEEA
jgi:hypothetical protein